MVCSSVCVSVKPYKHLDIIYGLYVDISVHLFVSITSSHLSHNLQESLFSHRLLEPPVIQKFPKGSTE